MKVLICGDRNWSNHEIIRSYIAMLQDWGYTEVVEGDARGADRIAGEEAIRAGLAVHVYPAQWDKYGRAAGYIRNLEMLDEQQPSLVLAFHNNLNESKGTAHAVNEARRRGIEVTIVTEDN